MLRPDPATLRAVEAHARALCKSFYGTEWEQTSEFRRGICREMSLAALPAYHAALGEDVRAMRVERCANMDGKEEG